MKCNLLSFGLISSILFLSSCSGIRPVAVAPVEMVPEYELPITPVKTVAITRGKVDQVRIAYQKDWGEVTLSCDSKPVGFDYQENYLRTYIAVPYEMIEGQIHCHLKFAADPKGREVPVLVVNARDYAYPSETLRVSKKHVDLAPEDLARWQNEVKELESVYSAGIMDRALFEAPFRNPLKSKITSFYGKRRVFNNKKEAVHKGVDYRAWTGTPIPTANKGKVVFAGELFFNGGTVIIDHGLGIMTMYCHLSKVQAAVGEIVPQGAIIGLSGNTGRSTAPHLHWGVRVGAEWVDGIALIKAGI